VAREQEFWTQHLLGVLSSDVVELFFRSMNGNTQVSATELNLLPIPRGGFETEIAGLVAELEDAGSLPKRADLEADLHERIARAYGLTIRVLGFLQRILHENPGAVPCRGSEAGVVAGMQPSWSVLRPQRSGHELGRAEGR